MLHYLDARIYAEQFCREYELTGDIKNKFRLENVVEYFTRENVCHVEEKNFVKRMYHVLKTYCNDTMTITEMDSDYPELNVYTVINNNENVTKDTLGVETGYDEQLLCEIIKDLKSKDLIEERKSILTTKKTSYGKR